MNRIIFKNKSEGGSISVYVIVSLVFLSIVLVSMLAASKNSNITSLKAQKAIKDIYEEDVASVDIVYNKVLEEHGEIFEIILDSSIYANEKGTRKIYEKYLFNFSLDELNTKIMSTDNNNITVPTRNDFYFCGYYTEEDGKGVRYIDANGYLTSDASNRHFIQNGTLYACWEKIPDEYQEVEYIESTGTQYIDTKFSPNNSSGLYLYVNYTVQPKKANKLYGVYYSNSTRWYGANPSDNGTKWSWGWGNWSETSSTFSTGDWKIYVNYDQDRKVTLLHNGVFNTIKTLPTVSFGNDRTAYLFAINSAVEGTVHKSSFRLKECKIYDNGTLVRDFVPCYAKTSVTNVEGTTCTAGTLGLYDKVNNKFYTNKGSGTFIKGSDV